MIGETKIKEIAVTVTSLRAHVELSYRRFQHAHNCSPKLGYLISSHLPAMIREAAGEDILKQPCGGFDWQGLHWHVIERHPAMPYHWYVLMDEDGRREEGL